MLTACLHFFTFLKLKSAQPKQICVKYGMVAPCDTGSVNIKSVKRKRTLCPSMQLGFSEVYFLRMTSHSFDWHFKKSLYDKKFCFSSFCCSSVNFVCFACPSIEKWYSWPAFRELSIIYMYSSVLCSFLAKWSSTLLPLLYCLRQARSGKSYIYVITVVSQLSAKTLTMARYTHQQDCKTMASLKIKILHDPTICPLSSRVRFREKSKDRGRKTDFTYAKTQLTNL